LFCGGSLEGRKNGPALLGVALVFLVILALGWNPVVDSLLPPATLTPYLPVTSTATRPVEQVLTITVTPQVPSFDLPEAIWQGLDLRDESPSIDLAIQPASETVNHGRSIPITIRPGRSCAFWDRRACITRFADASGRVILATVHSGVTGAGQAFRHALEGTAINRAAYSLEQIQTNMDALQDAAVTTSQGEATEKLSVLAVARIPPSRLDEYFGGPVTPFIEEIAGSHPRLRQVLDAGETVLVIETCGWRHPEEREASMATDTTGSIYLLVLGK
jgi:hypothetical protein